MTILMATSNVGHLEDEALKRKERLKALKRKREGASVSVNGTSHSEEAEALPRPIFRNYKPADDDLTELAVEPARPGDVSSEVKDQLESAKSEIVIDQLDVTSLAPRKPDWDLKRDVAKKLAKLERQTQKAIAELIRERLKERSEMEDLAAIVNAGVSSNT
ncbi:coiled-coil domain-containing protein 12 [Anoplophora glabripennis]|uniref:coiled-coil domain-containing protein 12 n=1 Tax=Anoplophora glabripennis TaxID=217634 RepID=UPI000874AC64|nr:coiled-coil domain-containing protein 12 [Anoplophora glabripennis]